MHRKWVVELIPGYRLQAKTVCNLFNIFNVFNNMMLLLDSIVIRNCYFQSDGKGMQQKKKISEKILKK